MKALVQRVEEAAVEVEGEIVGRIGRGFLVFLCAEPGDGAEDVEKLARKTARLRIFEDAQGKMNLALPDVGGAVLVVSQFTLAADIRRGNRPTSPDPPPPRSANGSTAISAPPCGPMAWPSRPASSERG